MTEPDYFHLGPYADTPEWGALPPGMLDAALREQLERELPGWDAMDDD